MNLNERIRRLEVAMAKKAQGVDPLAWYLAQYRDSLAGMTPDDSAAWHAFMTTGEGQPPMVPDGVIAAGCMLEAYCPGVIDHLPDNWAEATAMQELLSSLPPRKRVPQPLGSDSEAEARAAGLIAALEREIQAGETSACH